MTVADRIEAMLVDEARACAFAAHNGDEAHLARRADFAALRSMLAVFRAVAIMRDNNSPELDGSLPGDLRGILGAYDAALKETT